MNRSRLLTITKAVWFVLAVVVSSLPVGLAASPLAAQMPENNNVMNPSVAMDAMTMDSMTSEALQAIIEGDWARVSKLATELSVKFPDYALGQLLLASRMR